MHIQKAFLQRWFGRVLLLVALLITRSAKAEEASPPAPAAKGGSAAADGSPRQYVFQIGLYRLNQSGERGAAGIRHFPERHPPTAAKAGVPHVFGSLDCEQCHAVSWPRGAEGVLSRTLAEPMIGEALTSSMAQVIAEPVLTTVEGRAAHLRLQGGDVQYFVRNGEGTFRLETIKDQSGVELQLLVSKAKHENDTLNVTVKPFQIRITTLDCREPVEGVELPVGKPVFQTFEWDATLTCRPGQMNAFTVDSPRQGRILVVVRLQVPGEHGEALPAQESKDGAVSMAGGDIR